VIFSKCVVSMQLRKGVRPRGRCASRFIGKTKGRFAVAKAMERRQRKENSGVTFCGVRRCHS